MWHPLGAAGLVLAGAEGHADHQAARTADADDEQDPGVATDGAHHSPTRLLPFLAARRALSSSRALRATTLPGMASHSLPPRTGRICTRPPTSPMTTPMRPLALSFASSPMPGLVCCLLAMPTSFLPTGRTSEPPTNTTSGRPASGRTSLVPSPVGRRD